MFWLRNEVNNRPKVPKIYPLVRPYLKIYEFAFSARTNLGIYVGVQIRFQPKLDLAVKKRLNAKINF